jgi:hypothetical protein
MAQAQKSSKGAGGGGKAGSKGKKATAGGKKVEDEREETLQAVVLADSFETRFNPFTLETPRVSHCASSIIILKFLTTFDNHTFIHQWKFRNYPLSQILETVAW